jgi:cytochrome c-type biogenesis protein CcmH
MTRTFSLSILIVIITVFFFKTNIYSVEPEEFLENPKQELKARNISKNIRCLVCQNQSIDESAAALAKDLRILIRKKIKEGYTEDEVYKFLTDRYGDFILLRPPFKKSTIVLWFLPFVFLSIGIFVLFWYHKKSKKKLL